MKFLILRLLIQKKNIGAFKEFKVFLELNNLFDRHYVSSISAWDDTVSGASYYVGAPFSLKAGLSFKF
jgi:iron complex outermembrane receptor protein